MVNKNFWTLGQKFKTQIGGKEVSGEICSLPII
jgi:hypothetical protein